MKDFVIYSYQFAPVDNDPNLFINVQKKNKELMKKKNIIFDSIIDRIAFTYWKKLVHDSNKRRSSFLPRTR